MNLILVHFSSCTGRAISKRWQVSLYGLNYTRYQIRRKSNFSFCWENTCYHWVYTRNIYDWTGSLFLVTKTELLGTLTVISFWSFWLTVYHEFHIKSNMNLNNMRGSQGVYPLIIDVIQSEIFFNSSFEFFISERFPPRGWFFVKTLLDNDSYSTVVIRCV